MGSGNLTLNEGVGAYATRRFRATFPWAGADPITILLFVDSLERRIFGVSAEESTIVYSVDCFLIGNGTGIFLKLPRS